MREPFIWTTLVSLFSIVIVTSPAIANIQKFPLTHETRSPVQYHTVVGSHRDVLTIITPNPGGFHVSARFSQGDKLKGAHMCSSADFYDKDGQLVAQIRQMVGINATLGHRTRIDNKENDIVLSPDQQARVTFVEVGQAECPVNGPFDAGLKAFSTIADFAHVLAVVP